MLNKIRNFLDTHDHRPPASPQALLPYGHVSLFSPDPAKGRLNVSYHLSKIIVSRVLALRGLTLDDEVATGARLLAVGSILDYCCDGDVIWGAGISDPAAESHFAAHRLDVRAVRGPLTEECLRRRGIDVPAVYGDPALLVRHLFGKRFVPSGEKPYVFVPNPQDLFLVAGDPRVVSPLSGWNTVIAEIVKARLVLASSLHGLIIAESFGIPARYVRLSERDSLFRYRDYYLGTGRKEEFRFATSIPEGLEMGGMAPIDFDPQRLLSAFPWDLWQ